jgi:hypothetical protein
LKKRLWNPGQAEYDLSCHRSPRTVKSPYYFRLTIYDPSTSSPRQARDKRDRLSIGNFNR